MNCSVLIRTLALVAVFVGLTGFSGKSHGGVIVAGTTELHKNMASNPMFAPNGWLLGVDAEGHTSIAGNFVKIGDQKGITVAHVADGNGHPYVSMYASFSNSIYNEAPNYRLIDSWTLYPGFVDDNGSGQSDDIAVLHFAEPILDVPSAEIYWGNVQVGTHMYFSGVGYQSAYPSTAQSFSGDFYGGENIVSRVGWPAVGIESQFFLTDFGPAAGTPSLPAEMALLSVYSGSGAYNDDGKLIGLAAFGGGNYVSGFIRPAMYHDFITPVPEPSTFALVLVAVPIVAIAAKRRQSRRRQIT